MRYHALATDYDGTLAEYGRIPQSTNQALEKLRSSGRRVIIVTGRRLEEFLTVCPDTSRFDCIVAENGAVLYWPSKRETTLLAPAPPWAFLKALEERKVTPLEIGHVIVATLHPHEHEVIDAIYRLGLELQIIFNGDSVMVLPPGINKGVGLQRALYQMGLSRHEVVGVGNAGNDHSFLSISECSVAVGDAVPSLKEQVAFVTSAGASKGVEELIEEIVSDDLRARSAAIAHDWLVLGTQSDGQELRIPAYGDNLLVAGPSASGKSTFCTGLIERLIEKKYQLCIIDPEGDYSSLEEVVTLGSRLRAPEIREVMDMFVDPSVNLVVNLLGIHLEERPAFFAELFPQLQAMRVRTGRPHWIVVDEAHHLWPTSWPFAASTVPQRLGETILVTVHPDEVATPLLPLLNVAVAVGPTPEVVLGQFAKALGEPPPETPLARRLGEVVVWFPHQKQPPVAVKVIPARSERLRHLRKYAEGNLGPQSFIFRGPHAKLQLRAHNLQVFCQLASGVDEDTWSYHLKNGDYSRWVREVIKDPELALEITRYESSRELSPKDSLSLVRDAIELRYTAPAG